MGLFGPKEADGLKALFMAELKDIYWAEQALAAALPEMQSMATSEELATAIEEHLVETKNHATRLEEVFALMGEKPSTKKCKAMAGLIAEANEVMAESEEGVVRDAAIISCAQKVEHYEIASYGTLRAYALTLGKRNVANLLEATLVEEKETDDILTALAERHINEEAAKEGEK
jgi:ferritin-like metal-binding protein YciE